MRALVRTGNATRADALAAFGADGCSAPRSWSNGPGDTYSAHDHPRDKVLFCIEGSIVFTTSDGELRLEEGDRLDLPAGTVHGAVAGPDGCACVEAWGP